MMNEYSEQKFDQLLSSLIKKDYPLKKWMEEDESEAFDRIVGKRKRVKTIRRWIAAAAVAALVVAGAGLLRLSQQTAENAELIAEMEPEATEIHQETASDSSISTRKMMVKTEKQSQKEENRVIIDVSKQIVENGMMEVSGSVFSLTDKKPVSGAMVAVVGTKIGTATNMDGNFSLKCPKGSRLQVSYAGMLPTVVEAKSSLNLALAPDKNALDKTLVGSYGKPNKTEFTGSIQEAGTSMQTSDRIVVLLNGKEYENFPFEVLSDEKEVRNFFQQQNFELTNIKIWQVNDLHRHFNRPVHEGIVLEITALPIKDFYLINKGYEFHAHQEETDSDVFFKNHFSLIENDNVIPDTIHYQIK